MIVVDNAHNGQKVVKIAIKANFGIGNVVIDNDGNCSVHFELQLRTNQNEAAPHVTVIGLCMMCDWPTDPTSNLSLSRFTPLPSSSIIIDKKVFFIVLLNGTIALEVYGVNSEQNQENQHIFGRER